MVGSHINVRGLIPAGLRTGVVFGLVVSVGDALTSHVKRAGKRDHVKICVFINHEKRKLQSPRYVTLSACKAYGTHTLTEVPSFWGTRVPCSWYRRYGVGGLGALASC